MIGTAALVLCILAIVDKKNIGAPKGMEPLVIGLSILAIGVSMSLNCGYPINPARDLGPRLFTAVAGWGLEVFRYRKHLLHQHTLSVIVWLDFPLLPLYVLLIIHIIGKFVYGCVLKHNTPRSVTL